VRPDGHTWEALRKINDPCLGGGAKTSQYEEIELHKVGLAGKYIIRKKKTHEKTGPRDAQRPGGMRERQL